MAFRRRNNFSHSRNSQSRNSHHNQSKKEQELLAELNKTPDNPLDEVTFETVPQSIKEAYERAGWTQIMPVQAHSIPYLLAGRDMMIQSRTGSGKTGAYLLPIIERIDTSLRKAQALVLVPTRELAIQVEKEARNLFGDSIFTLTLYGGTPYGKQLDSLRRGAQLIIGTPGRVLDHLQKGTLNLDNLEALIFDEADRMLSIGFYPDMKAVQEYLPEKDMLTTLFSATYPHSVLKLAKEFLKNPELLSLSQGQVHIAEMQHLCVLCNKMEKDRTLIRLLEIENPSSAIIFCNTKATVHYVAQVLKGFGYNAEELSSELSQSKRENVLTRLRNGGTRFVVATDVAARGIDIPMLSHVFLYEPPEDRESYIHRAGRTGRAGAAGTVFSLADNMERMEVQSIAKFYSIDLIPYEAPTDADVEKIVSERVIALLEQEKRNLNGLQKERISRYLQLAEDFATSDKESQENDNIYLLAMLLDEVYQKSLNPAPVQNSSPRGRQRYNPPSASAVSERVLTPEDSLDSLRDDFNEEMRQKYGSRRGRSDRNASWRHEKSGNSDRNSRRSFRDRDRNDFKSDFRKERNSFRDNNSRSYQNDDDVFENSREERTSFRPQDNGRKSHFADFASPNNYSRRDEGNRDFPHKRDSDNYRNSRDDSRNNENHFSRDNSRDNFRDDFGTRKSFLPKKRSSFARDNRNTDYQEQDNHVIYKDDNFFLLPNSKKEHSENRFERDENSSKRKNSRNSDRNSSRSSGNRENEGRGFLRKRKKRRD